MDILELIKKEHSKVEALFSEIERADDTQKLYECFNELQQEINLHSEVEEQTFYTAIRNESTEGMVNHSQQEHEEAKQLLEEIEFFSPTSTEFKAKLQQLKQLIQQHIRKEENEVFSQARQCMNKDQLLKLALEFGAVKSKLLSEMPVVR